MASMRFCRQCNNMLYPKEDKEAQKLLYACRNCAHKEDAGTKTRIYRHELVKKAETQLEKIPDAVVEDPTLQRMRDAECPNEGCGHNEAVFWQAREGTGDDSRMAIIYVCCDCFHKWSG